MNFLDLFAGIGGFRLGMERAGHKCIGFVEIDKFANQSYRAIHDTGEEWERHDITKVTDDDLRLLRRERGPIHCICGGFPCQAFSVAGKRGGFSDTRGTLFFQIARFAEILRPQYLLLENVAGLLNHNNGDTFEVILRTLDELGFDAEWQVLNSKHFGVPQNRERVFIVGHSRAGSSSPVFPIEGTGGETAILQIGNIINTESFGGNPQRGRIYSFEGISPTLNTMQGGGGEPKIVLPCLTPNREEKRQNGRRFKEDGEPMFTLTAQDVHGVALGTISYGKWKERENFTCLDANYHKGLDDRGQRTGVKVYQKTHGKTVTQKINETGTLQAARVDKVPCIEEGWRIRKLTPRECWRLQGFPDWAFDKAKAAGVSDSQLYKQAGNSVTVNVIYEIAKRLCEGTII